MINSKENQFGTLLFKYMRDARASCNDMAEEIGVHRLTIIIGLRVKLIQSEAICCV